MLTLQLLFVILSTVALSRASENKYDLGQPATSPDAPSVQLYPFRESKFMLYQNWQSMYNDMNVQLAGHGKPKLYRPRTQRAAEPQEQLQKHPLIATKPIKIENWGLLRQPMAYKDEKDWITFPVRRISSDWYSPNANLW